MTRSTLAVSRPVIRDLVGRAVMEAPGVLRVGWSAPRWRRPWGGRALKVRVRHGVVEARVVVIARPGQALGEVAAEVRATVAAAIERLLGLEVGEVTVRVDGVGG